MPLKQILGLIIRLYSIWLAMVAIQTIGVAYTMTIQYGENGITSKIMYVFPVLIFMVSVLLWKFPMTIAGKLVPPENEKESINIQSRELAAILSAVLGLWAIIVTVPAIVTNVGLVLFFFASLSDEKLFSMVLYVIQLVLGGFLLCKPWSVSNAIFGKNEK